MLRAHAAVVLLVSALLAFPGRGLAQTPQSDAVKAMLGAWELSNADRDKICMITFRPESAPGGRKLDFDKACAEVFALTKGVTAWTLGANDTLRFVDAKGKAVLEVSEVESGMFEGERAGEGLYFLQNLAAASAAARPAEQMSGDWAVMREADKPICIITFSKTAAGDGTLKLKPGCDATVAAFNPSSWHMERGELVMSAARGGVWRFEESDAVTWHRITDDADSVMLVRQ